MEIILFVSSRVRADYDLRTGSLWFVYCQPKFQKPADYCLRTGNHWFAYRHTMVCLTKTYGSRTGSLYFSTPVVYHSATGNLSIENRQLIVLSFRKLSKLSFVSRCISSDYSSPIGSLWFGNR